MKPCGSCPRRSHCRVPHDMAMMHRVMHRLEDQHRTSPLTDRLHHYLDDDHCLVELGCVDA